MESAMTRQWLRAAVLILFLGLSQAVWAGPQVWEYTILSQREGTGYLQEMESRINELGQEGWELVAVTRHDVYVTLFFKRPR
jgi:hypothetical protein